nr:MAG TPA: hypothetical protein [Caudoviricetes sp.]
MITSKSCKRDVFGCLFFMSSHIGNSLFSS